MKHRIKSRLAVLGMALGLGLWAGHSQALAISLSGSASFSAAGGVALSGGANLFVPHVPGLSEAESLFASPLKLALANTVFGAANTGDYAALDNQGFTANPANTLVLADPLSYIVQAAATIGVFTPDPNSVSFSSSANFLNITSTGLLAPGLLAGVQPGGCATGGNSCAPTVSELNLSFTKTGSAVSMSGTLFSPASTVPEPASLGLLAAGLAACRLAGRRRPACEPAYMESANHSCSSRVSPRPARRRSMASWLPQTTSAYSPATTRASMSLQYRPASRCT